jgi:hypothetical protein
MSSSLEMFEHTLDRQQSFLPNREIDQEQFEKEIDDCGTGRKRRKLITFNRRCKVTLRYIFVGMLLIISVLETLSMVINKLDGIDIPTLSNVFTKAIQEIDIPNATSNAIKNSILLDLFNKYSHVNITPHDIG